MYYVYIEAWCLGYAINAVTGNLSGAVDFGHFFATFTGAAADGVALHFGLGDVGIFVFIVYVLNFYFIFRGITKGIEKLCVYAMPALIVIAFIVLVRVLTLSPNPQHPERNVLTGLGFMWNPGDLIEGLKNPLLWLAASGQIFFSLSVGMGVIVTYSSYLKDQDDVVLSCLTASAANEFCEVGLGGLITLPSAFIFIGGAGLAGQGTFGLGFNILPQVFSQMPAGQFFAAIFFFLLFLAAITSSLSMLQPGIAFLEEGLGLRRQASVTLLGFIAALGTLLVWYFSKDLKALDTLDFWVGTLFIFIQATIIVVLFGWKLGIDVGWQELHRGAQLQVPRIFKWIIKYVTPAYLLVIFALFVLQNVAGWNFKLGSRAKFVPTGYIRDLVGPDYDHVARLSIAFISVIVIFTLILIHLAGKRWAEQQGRVS
jgi:neurotransmitter:Na+ symporter, NSS family